MRVIASMILCACGVTLCGASQVGVSIAEIALPIESVVVSQKAITVAEKEISRAIPDAMPLTQQDFYARVGGVLMTEAERVDAFNRIIDQELVFKLFFKPGEDSNVAIRKLALSKLVEVELVRAIADKIKKQELREFAIARLKSIYISESDLKTITESRLASLYVKRMRNSK
jgi:hypothetical protein